MASTRQHLNGKYPSRRRLLQAAVAMTAVSGLAALDGFDSDGIAAEKKMTQAAVKYQNSPKDGKRCADCKFFLSDGKCQRVEGNINPEGWCTLWIKK